MKFCDFVKEEAIKPELEAQDKEGVIQELVASLVASGMLDADNQESIVEAIMKREELGSTGIGRGIAVPHTNTRVWIVWSEQSESVQRGSTSRASMARKSNCSFCWCHLRIDLEITFEPWKTSRVNFAMRRFAGF